MLIPAKAPLTLALSSPARSLLLMVCLSVVGAAHGQTPPGWNLVWADEFNEPTLDLSKWSYEVNGTGGGNNELQYYTDRPTNSFIHEGRLIIQALQESYTGPDGTRNYTSARLRTINKGDWTYGRIEARMKLPYGQGLWPAFWMLPTDWLYGGWAASGEIDIMELVGHEPNTVHGTIHYHGEWPNNWQSGKSWTLPSGDFSDDFHVFTLEWEEGEMRWYVDGNHFSTKSSWDTTGGAPFPAPFDQRFHILLNVAVGGNWPGHPDDTTVFPQQMAIDYVRVYSATNTTPPTNSSILLNSDFENGELDPWVGKGGGNANRAGGNVVDLNGLVWDPSLNAVNNQGIKNPTFGAYSCKVYGDYSGGPNATGFYQNVDAAPGSAWTAILKARTQNPDQIRGDNWAVATVSFRDTSNNVLAEYKSQVFNADTPINAWIELNVTNQTLPFPGTTNKMHTPAGTATMRFDVTFSQNLYDWGSIYFDEVQLQEVVLKPTCIDATLNRGNLDLSFPTNPLLSYRVLYKTNMSDSSWTPLTTVTGNGSVVTVSDPVGVTQRIYTVQTMH